MKSVINSIFILFLSISFSEGKIHFVYNANDDFFSMVGDFIHKSFSPKTYPCDLCALSYGTFYKKKKWANYLNSLDHEYTFIYKNESNSLLKFVDSYPTILYQIKDDVKVIATKFEISNCKNVDDLITLINNKLIRLEKSIK